MYVEPTTYEIVYRLGELELAQKAVGPDAVHRAAELLISRGHVPLIREPDGRVYTLGQFRARQLERSSDLQPEEILQAARRRA